MIESIAEVYRALERHYPAQGWWPGDSQFEVMVGAILTQNTAWRNVEKALHGLRCAGCLNLERIQQISAAELAQLIRPAGYFNLKARRLHNLCHWLGQNGGIEVLSRWPTKQLRRGLLSINGVGPETADDILLYAFRRAVFVVDTYTQRLFGRIGLTTGRVDYETLRHQVEREIADGVPALAQFHALIVEHAKSKCRKSPLCEECPLRSGCDYGMRQTPTAH